MFNLLPFESKRAVRREYRRRVLLVGLALVFLAELIAVSLLVPTFVLSRSAETDLAARKESLSVRASEGEGGTFADVLKRTTDKLQALAPEKNPADAANAVWRAAAAKTEGVHVRRISYTAGKDLKTADIRVEGVADSRDALLSFKQSLQRESLFTKVDLPISSFTKEEDIAFSVALTATFVAKP